MCVGVVSEKAESVNPAVLNVILSVVFLTFSLFEFEYGAWGGEYQLRTEFGRSHGTRVSLGQFG